MTNTKTSKLDNGNLNGFIKFKKELQNLNYHHSPIPYKKIRKLDSSGLNMENLIVSGKRVIQVSNACGLQDIADSDFILKACNSHYDLLEALKHLVHNAKKSGAEMGLAIDVAEAAIEAAEAK